MFSIGKFQFNLNRWLKNWESFWPNEQFSNIYIYIVKKFGKGILTSSFYHVSLLGSRLPGMKNRMDEVMNACNHRTVQILFLIRAVFFFTFCIRFIFVILNSFDLNLQNICIIYRSFDNQKYFNFYKVNNVESMWCEAIYIYIYKK